MLLFTNKGMRPSGVCLIIREMMKGLSLEMGLLYQFVRNYIEYFILFFFLEKCCWIYGGRVQKSCV